MSDSKPEITLYTTGVCPYCNMAKAFLKAQGYEVTREIRVDVDVAEREKMIALTKRTSVPQIFIGDLHVGGYDDLMAMHRKGELLPLLGAGTP